MLSAIVAFIILCYICRLYQTKSTKYYYQPSSKLWQDLFSKTNLLTMKYQPWTFAINGHFQAIWFGLIEYVNQLLIKNEFDREIFSLSDGGILALDWYLCEQEKESLRKKDLNKEVSQRPLLAVVPGITGDNTKMYMISLVKAAQKNNFDFVCINYRGLGGVPLKTTKIYHGGDTQDLKEAINYIYEEYCDNGSRRQLLAVGVSLGAGVLANYLCREKGNTPLTAACCLACHFDTFKAMEFLSNHMYGIYDYSLGYFCKISSRSFFKQYDEIIAKKYPDRVVFEENEKVLKISDHYSKLVAKVAGYKSIKEYFFDSTITHKLKDIRVPTFFLNSLDDPFYGPYVIPIDQCSENILLGVTKTGGHVCYFQGAILPTSQWYTEPTFEFLNYFVKYCQDEELIRSPSLSTSYSLQ